MKLDNDARFPYPVLATNTFDYKEADFNFTDQVEVEETSNGKTKISFKIELNEKSLNDAIASGKARIGIYIRCPATFFSELSEAPQYEGSIIIKGGVLRGKVFIRPLVWAKEVIENYTSNNLVEEFHKSWNFEKGKLLAYADEQSFYAGREKIVPMSTIFKLEKRPGFKDGEVRVEPELNKIIICSSNTTHDKLARLRKGNKKDRTIMMNTVYLQAVMKILSDLQKSPNTFEEHAWFSTFDAQCQQRGINYENCDILTAAQALLKYPINEL